MVEAVGTLRKAFEATLSEQAEAVGDPPEGVMASCAALANWMAQFKAPRGLGKAEGELGAVAGVYRNAAFAYRSLADADDDSRAARRAACATMLEQGDHHVEVFLARVAKKVRIDRTE